VLTTLGTKAFFGEMALLNPRGNHAVTSVRAKGFCEAQHLSSAAYEQLLSQYPSFKEYVELVARLRLTEDVRQKKGVQNAVEQMGSSVPKTEGAVSRWYVARKQFQQGDEGPVPMTSLFSAIEGAATLDLNHFTRQLLKASNEGGKRTNRKQRRSTLLLPFRKRHPNLAGAPVSGENSTRRMPFSRTSSWRIASACGSGSTRDNGSRDGTPVPLRPRTDADALTPSLAEASAIRGRSDARGVSFGNLNRPDRETRSTDDTLTTSAEESSYQIRAGSVTENAPACAEPFAAGRDPACDA
jgi:hypothetical protein